ncbi:hypothetical protein OIV83_005614 [Microbotryomycetes sp. JL201]|nr:hypothetical protein OIV83_005614 [Microbotryomycetes sp. JL201]
MTAPFASTSAAPAVLPSPQFPPLSQQDVLACSFSSWYPLFRRHSPKATVIRPLSSSFVDYLESDGLFLPEGSGPMGISELSDSDSETEEIDADGSSDDERRSHYSFPELDAEDAAWMIPGQNLKCQTPADVYLLLKSSDFILHDLDHAFEHCVGSGEGMQAANDLHPAVAEMTLTADGRASDPDVRRDVSSDEGSHSLPRRTFEIELVLKKWFDMPKSQEWRCFVRDRRLVAISQRDGNFYEFLQPADVQADLKSRLSTFFESEIRATFPLSSYVFDVYLTRAGDRVFVVDFNPYAPHTDPLLFSWDVINELGTQPLPTDHLPILRTVESAQAAAQSMPRFSHNRYPKDVVELSSGSSIAEFAQEWNSKLQEGVSKTLAEEADKRKNRDIAGR